MNKRIFLTVISTVMCMMAWCADVPEAGKYYRIVNQNPEKAVTTEGTKRGYVIEENKISYGLTAVEPLGSDAYTQIWKCTSANGGAISLQNALTQRYIGTASRSVQVKTVASSTTITLTDKGDYFLLTNGMQLHADGGNVVVGWNDAANKSNWWAFEEITDIDPEALAAAHDKYVVQQEQKKDLEAIVAKSAVYAPIIAGYFKDVACTELTDALAAKTDAQMRQMMQDDELPTLIQDMILGIKNRWSGEYDPEFSQQFRIQEYKAYPVAGQAKAYTKATQISDMNNITGIWTDALQLLFVWVEGDIPSNATLSMAQTSGDLGRAWSGDGTRLHSGLNIIYCGTDLANNWIMYTVPFSSTKPIAEYPKLKIHIEGGYAIGYTDIANMSEDEANALYKKNLIHANGLMKSVGYTDLAKDRIDYAVKGRYGIQLWPLECYNRIWSPSGQYSVKDYKIYKSQKFYDDVLMWEWGAMGITKRIVDGEGAHNREMMTGGYDIVPTYINNLAPAMMMFNGGKNPYSSDGYTCMPGVGGVESSYNAERADFDTWCVGHESGHNNQHTINLPSSMESSNNYFSNIITYQQGYRLSRGWSFMQNMPYTTSKTLFPQRDISITMRMYFNLYLYYHRAGRKTDFSPTLHKLLRDDPMSFGGDGWWDGPSGGANMGRASNSWLKFYEKVCDAAQEDLTEYFRMWGFFYPTDQAKSGIKHPNGRWFVYCGDYSSYYVENTQEMIDAAIARVKAKGYRENKEIMFIEDRLKMQQRHDAWAREGDMKPTNDGNRNIDEAKLHEWYGHMGYVEDYRADATPAQAQYTYTCIGTQMVLEGTGGVGIIFYDKENPDSIVWMSNTLNFELPVSVARTGFIIKAINADGTEVDVVDAAESEKSDDRRKALLAAVAASGKYTSLADATGTRVGFYSSDQLADLTTILGQSQTALDSYDAENYYPCYKALNDEMLRLSEEGMTVLTEGATYYLENKRAPSHWLAGKTGDVLTSVTSKTSNLARWAFINAADGKFIIQNKSTNKMLKALYNEKNEFSGWDASALTKEEAHKFQIIQSDNGAWFITLGDNAGKCINFDNSGKGPFVWSQDEGSKWYVTRYEVFDVYSDEDINNLIQDTRDLAATVGTYKETDERLTMQSTNPEGPNYLSVNYEDSSYPVQKVINQSSFDNFYTDSKATATAPHHFLLNLGTGLKAQTVKIAYYTDFAKTLNNPKTISVQAGSSATSFSNTTTVLTDLPQGRTKQERYQSSAISSNKAFQFWRFQVTETHNTEAGANPFFGMAELYVYITTQGIEYNPGYEAVPTSTVLNALTATTTAESSLQALSTPLTNKATYDALKKQYDLLKAAIDKAIPTGIEGITEDEDAESDTQGETYDLSGRSVRGAMKGIQIRNGKKYIVK